MARRLPHAIPLGFSGLRTNRARLLAHLLPLKRSTKEIYAFIEGGETALKSITEIILIGFNCSRPSHASHCPLAIALSAISYPHVYGGI